MAKNLIPLLPFSSEGSKISINKSGEWQLHRFDLIKEVAEDLEGSNDFASLSEIHVVPDFLAILTMYYEALNYSDRKIDEYGRKEDKFSDTTVVGTEISFRHNEARGAWRSLISLLACANAMPHYEVNILTLIDLGNFQKNNWLITFFNELKERQYLVPDILELTKKKENYDFEDLVNDLSKEIAVITLNQLAVGIVISGTWVAPLRSFQDGLQIPSWLEVGDSYSNFNSGFFKDPLSNKNFSEQELVRTLFFLKQMNSKASEALSKNSIVSLQIKEFIEDVEVKLDGVDRSDSFVIKPVSDDNIDKLSDSLIFLKHRVAVKENKFISEAFILPAGGKVDAMLPEETSFYKFIYFDAALPCKIWSGDRQLTYDIDKDKSILAASGFYLFDVNDFFTSDLILLSNSISDGPVDVLNNVLLPIKEELLLFVSVSDLRDSIKINKLDSNKFEVSIPIQLSKFDFAKGRMCNYKHVITRTYSKDIDSIFKVLDGQFCFNMARWPDFYSNDWKYYFSCVLLKKNNNVIVESVYDSTKLPISSLVDSTKVENIQDSLTATKIPISDPSDQDDYPVQISFSNTPVDIFVCKLADQPQVRGIFIFKKPEFIKSQQNKEEYSVGLDFGTTRSSIYYKSAASDVPKPFNINPMCAFVTDPNLADESPESAVIISYLENMFVNSKPVNVPILSLYKERLRNNNPVITESFSNHNNHIRLSSDLGVPFYIGGIVFGQLVHMVVDDLAKNIQNYVSNLKWSGDTRTKNNIRRFIFQIVLQVSAQLMKEGVDYKNTTWSFSLPGSMFQRRQKDLAKIFSEAICDDFELGKDRLKGPYLESQAAFVYAKSLRTLYMSGTFYVDIGGGSTDVCLFHEFESEQLLVWQNSYKIAGQDIIVKFLVDRFDLFKKFLELAGIEGKLLPKEGEYTGDSSLSYILIELILNSKTFTDIMGTPSRLLKDHELYRSLSQRVRLSVWFILDVIFEKICSLEKGHHIISEIALGNAITVFFGGGGANLLKYFYPGNDFINDVLLKNYLRRKRIKCMDSIMRIPLELQISQMPKSEVAFGLSLINSSAKPRVRIKTETESLNLINDDLGASDKDEHIDATKINLQAVINQSVTDLLSAYDKSYGTFFSEILTKENFSIEVQRRIQDMKFDESVENYDSLIRIGALSTILDNWSHYGVDDLIGESYD